MMEDRTGKPLRVEELKQARSVVIRSLSQINSTKPELFVELLTIKLALDELIQIKLDVK